MGRRPDPPEVQAAKGNPGRRTSKVKQRQAEREAAAAALAQLPVGTKVEPPAMLRGKGYEKALEVWADLGPELERTHRLQPIHRNAFAMFCVYIAEWWEAAEDLAANGRSQTVPTVSGGAMERDRPAVRWRAEAFANAMEAAKQFGLTPREEYALFKDQAGVAQSNPQLFGAPAAANDKAPAAATSIGGMARLKSQPPAGTA